MVAKKVFRSREAVWLALQPFAGKSWYGEALVFENGTQGN